MNSRMFLLVALATSLALAFSVTMLQNFDGEPNLPGHEAEDEVLNIRGALTGPCIVNNAYDWCVVRADCGTDQVTSFCTNSMAKCYNTSGAWNLYCQNWLYSSVCTPATRPCVTGLRSYCKNVAGESGNGCKCTSNDDTQPTYSVGTSNTC
jgi:hypothetical protein